MKKLIALLLALVMLMALVACTAEPKPTETQPKPTETNPPRNIRWRHPHYRTR